MKKPKKFNPFLFTSWKSNNFKNVILKIKSNIKNKSNFEANEILNNQINKVYEKDEILKHKKLIKEYKKNSEEYKIKRNTLLKVTRVILWIMITTIFIRGISSIFKRSETEQVQALILGFQETYKKESLNLDMYSFASNFAKEYLTFNESEALQDYKKRIEPFASNFVINNLYLDGGNSKVIYSSAFKIENYENNRYDIFVLVETEYVGKIIVDDVVNDNVKSITRTLKVPVLADIKTSKFIVEDIPQFVSQINKLDSFQENINIAYSRLNDSDIQEIISNSLNNFFKSYYEDNQSVINYYLHPRADRSKFLGLNGEFVFKEITNLSTYVKGNEYLVVLSLIIQDINGISYKQNFNVLVSIDYDSMQAFLKDINTRIININ